MKKIVIACLCIFTGVFCFASSDELEMYIYLYRYAQTQEEQMHLIQGMAASDISGAGEFYGEALKRLVGDYQNIRGNLEKTYADSQALLLANLIGQEKYEKAADDLWRIYNLVADSLVKREALIALGKIRAVRYLPQVIMVLTNLNNSAPGRDRVNSERIAYGAIVALEKYGDMSGYLPVYLASKSWYPDMVKAQALRSIKVLSEDPTEPMIAVINSAGHIFEDKLTALQAIDAAGVPAESKSKAAVAALDVGWRSSTTDTRQRGILADMRKLAIRMIHDNGCSDSAVYPLLEKSYRQYADLRTGGDAHEAYDAINTLGVLATEDAARTLVVFLARLNERRRDNDIQQREEDLVRRVIPALGATKQTAVAQRELRVVTSTQGWTSTVHNLANAALRQLR